MKLRQFSLRFIKTVIPAAVCLLLGIILGRSMRSEVYLHVVDDVYKVVDHVNIDKSDLEMIYRDPENDVAYYRYVGERDLTEVGQTVYLHGGEECSVTSTGAHGFTISSTSVNFVVGMSGDPILDKDGNQIGYISALLKNGDVYCIWS